ncbi:MAG: EAL domain-containing protein [Anaerolineales bacterium]
MTTQLRVLIVEDSEDDALLLVQELRRGGYAPEFERVDTRKAMLAALEESPWDLVITDHNMPQFDSTEALALVKKTGIDVPVIIVSGSIGEDIAVEAMKAGAHDYVMKNNLVRLVPATRRELREAETRVARKKAEAAIRHMAYHDALTGLVNRSGFEQHLQHAVNSAQERALNHALLYLDLDQFKIINDTCGHVAGDELLRQLATVMNPHIRDSDILARLGGDEFGVLLESCPLESAQKIGESLLNAIKNFRFVWRDKSFTIGASIGMVLINKFTLNTEEALSNADMACYAAKDLGRNRIYLYTESDENLMRRHGEMQWVSRINQALDENRFVLYRQCIEPINGDKQTKFCEFLLRLREPDGRIILPQDFIPAAERYNLMPTLDRWVVDNAFSILTDLADDGSMAGLPKVFFINLSGASLSDESFFDFVRDRLQKYNIPPQSICFEITETAAIAQLNKAVEFIGQIKKLGCRFALDDFGSGMSSFSYLKSIPVDYLKIDGSFISNMLNDSMARAIVEAINNIGHVAGIRTIAEFVENQAIKDVLTEIGVDYAQGYGIEKPRPFKENNIITRSSRPSTGSGSTE